MQEDTTITTCEVLVHLQPLGETKSQPVDNHVAHCRQSYAAMKYLEAVEALKAVGAQLEDLRQQCGNFDWDAESAGLETAKTKLHGLDKHASSISGELSGLSKVRAQLAVMHLPFLPALHECMPTRCLQLSYILFLLYLLIYQILSAAVLVSNSHTISDSTCTPPELN